MHGKLIKSVLILGWDDDSTGSLKCIGRFPGHMGHVDVTGIRWHFKNKRHLLRQLISQTIISAGPNCTFVKNLVWILQVQIERLDSLDQPASNGLH